MIFRVHANRQYKNMSIYHLRDKNLSLKAKGLLSWMLTNEDDWDYTIAGIVACCKEGEVSITNALNELEKNKYVIVTKHNPDSENPRIHYTYDIYEQPQGVCFLGVENQGVENQGQSNTNISNNIINNNTISKDIVEDFQFGTKKSKKKSLYDKCIDMINDFTNDAELRDLLVKSLRLFLENSREAGTSFYTNHFKGKLNKLNELGVSVNHKKEIVQQTLDNGWNGFYELKSIVRRTGNFAEDVEHLQGGLNKQASKKGGQNESAKF